ncbi:MAG: 2-isopropylmalate synthase [Candidatus Desantisbacteria bacterium]
MSAQQKVFIFDTTLRDGEQSPGASMEIRQKIEIARQLSKLGVDVIEAGFPMTSEGDFEAVRLIAREVEGPIICGLARAVPDDITRAWEALKDAARPRIHTFISSSDIQIKHQLRKTREEVIVIAKDMVSKAKEYTADIEFSPMDATRTDPEFLYELLEAVIEAGATTLNIPDTVGYAIPQEFGQLIASIKKNVRGIDTVVISVHCHNDLGLSTANSLSAIANGCRQVECTINGIGERAGNAALEEVVMAINTRSDLFGCTTGIDTTQIHKISRLVSRATSMIVQPNKAIVGANAFAHESGIHQDGMLKEKTTFEIMTPESIGLKESRLVLGKLSGRHAFKARLQEIGYDLNDEELNRAFITFKRMADKKREITDSDLEALVSDELQTIKEIYRLEKVQIICGTPGITPVATVSIKNQENKIIENTASGDGPIDAIGKAIEAIVGIPLKLVDFSVQAVGGGKDAAGEVNIHLESGEHLFSGRGTDTDIVVASAKAFVHAANKMIG